MYLSRQVAEMKHGDTFPKYESEIDQTVQQMDQSDPAVYEKAYQMVMSRHIEDIRAQDRQDMKAELKAELLAEMKGTTAAPPSVPGRGSNAPPAPSKRRIVIKPELKRQYEAEAFAKGMDPKIYIATKTGA